MFLLFDEKKLLNMPASITTYSTSQLKITVYCFSFKRLVLILAIMGYPKFIDNFKTALIFLQAFKKV